MTTTADRIRNLHSLARDFRDQAERLRKRKQYFDAARAEDKAIDAARQAQLLARQKGVWS
jgi:hypothetical protein